MVRRLDELVAELPFLEGLQTKDLQLIAGCGSNVHFRAGDVLFRAGDPADSFFVVRGGSVAIETHVPQRGAVTIETIEAGDVIGWSWLFPPYRWHFGAVAARQVHAIQFSGVKVMALCREDPSGGMDLMRRFMGVVVDRLQATRIRLLDLYGYQS